MPRSPVLCGPSLAFDDQGRARSNTYGDIYHGLHGAVLQSRQVFLAASGLPGRWRGRRNFTILETGFGFGVNFLAAWHAWRADAARSDSLHFASVESHLPVLDDLLAVHGREPDLASLAAQLRSAWPQPLAGVHRLRFDDGRVTLTLSLGDISHALPALRLRADAFFLDGFAPDRNPAMWTPQVMRELARKAADDATVATWCSAGGVRRALASAGFEIERRPGQGGKFETTAGRFAPRWRVRRTEPPLPELCELRHAVVVGGGIAGSAAAQALCARGWRVDLFDQATEAATGGSANRAGVFHPVIGTDDGVHARLSRAGFFLALARWRELAQCHPAFEWSPCGVLQVHATMDCSGYPAAYARAVDAQEARRLSGIPTVQAGVFYELGGWVSPRSLARALLDGCAGQLRVSFDTEVAGVERVDDSWRVVDTSGKPLCTAPVIVFATGNSAMPGPSSFTMRGLRGVVSYLPAISSQLLQVVLLGNGFVTPAVDGVHVAGATYEPEDEPPLPEADAHRQNLATASRLLGQSVGGAIVGGRIGWRAVTPDRLPAIGPLADESALTAMGRKATGLHLQELPRLPGLYAATGNGSRGLLSSALSGELLADMIEGRPRCIEASLVDAIDPGRFALRQARRRNAIAP